MKKRNTIKIQKTPGWGKNRFKIIFSVHFSGADGLVGCYPPKQYVFKKRALQYAQHMQKTLPKLYGEWIIEETI